MNYEQAIPILLENPSNIMDFPAELIYNDLIRNIVIAMQEMVAEGVTPNLDILKAQFKKINPVLVDHIEQIMMHGENLPDIHYYIWELKDAHNNKVLLEIPKLIEKDIREGERGTDIANHVEAKLSTIAGKASARTAQSVMQGTMNRLRKIYNNEMPPIWKTNKPEIDRLVSYGPKQLIMVAAQQKIGKSRFVTEQALDLYNLNKNLKINWYSFEMSEEEVATCLISYYLSLSTNIIEGKDRLPTPKEQEQIYNSEKLLSEHRIRFVNEKMTMTELTRDILRHSDDHTINIVDNIGLIRAEDGREGNSHDDYIAGEFVDIRDRSQSLIFLLHHLSKAAATRFNKENFYEPNVTDLRGSNRLADYINTLILLHRVEMYPDLMALMSVDQWQSFQKKMLVKVPFSRSSSVSSGRLNVKHALECCRTYLTTEQPQDPGIQLNLGNLEIPYSDPSIAQPDSSA